MFAETHVGENLETSLIETNRAALPAAVAAFMALLLLYSRQIKPARHIFTKYRSTVVRLGSRAIT